MVIVILMFVNVDANPGVQESERQSAKVLPRSKQSARALSDMRLQWYEGKFIFVHNSIHHLSSNERLVSWMLGSKDDLWKSNS